MVTRPNKLNDPAEVQAAIDKYFQDRENNKEIRELKNGDKKIYKTPPSILGLCLALDINRDTFYSIVNKEGVNVNKEISDVLIHAKDRIAQELMEGVLMGYWNEKVSMAQLAKYGELNNDQEEKTVKIIMQGNNEWSK